MKPTKEVHRTTRWRRSRAAAAVSSCDCECPCLHESSCSCSHHCRKEHDADDSSSSDSECELEAAVSDDSSFFFFCVSVFGKSWNLFLNVSDSNYRNFSFLGNDFQNEGSDSQEESQNTRSSCEEMRQEEALHRNHQHSENIVVIRYFYDAVLSSAFFCLLEFQFSFFKWYVCYLISRMICPSKILILILPLNMNYFLLIIPFLGEATRMLRVLQCLVTSRIAI